MGETDFSAVSGIMRARSDTIRDDKMGGTLDDPAQNPLSLSLFFLTLSFYSPFASPHTITLSLFSLFMFV